MNINKIDKINEFDIDIPDNIKEIYEVVNDNIKIGYVFILDDNINEIYIYIKEEYRSNGYGTEVFKNILKKFNDRKELFFNIDLKNIIAICMIVNQGGINLGNSRGYTKLVLPIR